MRNHLLITLLTLTFNLQAQISGVVNTYHAVTNIDIANATVVLDNVTGLTQGDTVFFIQVKGAEIDLTNTNNYGKVIDYKGTGLYEYNVICSISANTVIFERQFYNTYNPSGIFQVIGFTRYGDVSITGLVTCPSWDSAKGGIVIISASGTIDMQADIDVSAKGFRGGQHIDSPFNCNFTNNFDDYEYVAATGVGAKKGEGIAMHTANDGGRGPLGNGGGGGNDHNSGGGGGSNIKDGGKGGDNDDPNLANCHGYNPGEGGRNLDEGPKPLFFGGGGGAGHSNSVNNSSGGNGGGIVILIANKIEGNGHTIYANGADGIDAFGDGGGGGGGAGTVFFYTSNVASTVNVNANGGWGGDANGFSAPRCFGPGGGGSGGHVTTSESFFPSNVNTILNGGSNGVVTNSTAACLGSDLNAQDGQNGSTTNNYTINLSDKCNLACLTNPQPVLYASYNFCTNDTALVDGGAYAGATYDWSNGSTTQINPVTSAGQVELDIYSGRCHTYDTTNVFEVIFPSLLIEHVFTICTTMVVVDGNNPGSAFVWSDGSTGTNFTATNQGTYTVTITNGGLCSVNDEFKVVYCLTIPNTITPNNDGFNDVFEILGISEYPGNKVTIYSRNGAKVFEASEYKNDWDAGNVPDGVYMYAVFLNNGTADITGTLSVVRKQ
ncbi:MAG TPA: gliding motility-associated C-terminal domain-containing protein [Flavobacteriales bacterium]|nr:gliding motility-associated C-terminal domain-containing protein [Flavobacteriales bacterium]